MEMLARNLYEPPSRPKEAIVVTVHLADGVRIRFRCIGALQVKTSGRWRLDLARSLDPVPSLPPKQMADLCRSLTEELAALLRCTVTKVQPDRVDLED